MNTSAILVVEDDAISGSFFRAALEPYQISVCTRAQEALVQVSHRSFQLWLIDLNLPDMGGRELLHALHSCVPAPPPALAMSAEMPPALINELEALGFDGALAKPLSVDALRLRIDELLGVARPLDDAIALRAAGGNATLVKSLRTLWSQQLPHELQALRDEIEGTRPLAAADRLHRMQASAAFCGATSIRRTCARMEHHLRNIPHVPAAALLALLEQQLQTALRDLCHDQLSSAALEPRA